MDRVAALVLAGGKGGQFGVLSQHRTKAAFPVAGYYRIIDFVLSNLSLASVRHVGIIIQYLPASLVEHIGSGRPWDFDMADRRLQFMTPFVGIQETRWFHGTGDAIAKNLNLLVSDDTEDVLIVSGEHVYRMDYRKLVAQHRARKADVTFACVKIPPDKQHPRFGSVVTDNNGRIRQFEEKPVEPIGDLVSMGVYCFKRSVLVDLLHRARSASPDEHFSLARDVLQNFLGQINAYAYHHAEPWHYLADIDDYFDFHMMLARGEIEPMRNGWDIMTNFSDRHLGSRPPSYCSPESHCQRALISPDCRIKGDVYDSVLSPGVEIGAGALIEQAVIFHDSRIGKNARLQHVIVDKDAIIEDGAVVGCLDGPVTIIPKGYRVTAGEKIEAGADLHGDALGVAGI